MKSLIIILIGLYASWHFTDLSSESSLYSILAPVGVFVFFISLALWLVLKAGFGGKTDSSGAHLGSDGGFDGGGDS